MNREFVEYLSQRTNETLAVATILHTAGSTPRKAGTSMVVFPDGSIFGTIGGGRAENEIRMSAIDSIEKRENYRRIEVKLDDDVAVQEDFSITFLCNDDKQTSTTIKENTRPNLPYRQMEHETLSLETI